MFDGTRRVAPRHLGLSMAAVALALCLAPASADAVSAPQLLTFGDYETGTEISTQYEGQGVVFKDESGFYPEIRWDESAYTNPVLSGTFGFGSPIRAQFVVPGSTTPATVENLAMDVGYIDEPGSTELVVERSSGGPTELFADEYGFNHLSAAGGGISGFHLEGIGEEPHGFELDNLEYTIPPPPPPPPSPAAPTCPKFAIYDSRGSGEPRGEISNPGKDFLKGFKERLSSLHSGATVSEALNLYPAVGVWSWNPIDPNQRLNGWGAFLHSTSIGAYKDSEDQGEADLKTLIRNQVKSACGKSGKTKMILLGYSQGAEVTGNAYEQISDRERQQIAAVVLWGDPQYNNADKAADRDNRNLDGSLGTRPKFPDGSKVFSYCNTHDPICQWRLPYDELVYYRLKEHSLYWKTGQAKNDGSAVASFLVKGH